jgi:hypothetical protein
MNTESGSTNQYIQILVIHSQLQIAFHSLHINAAKLSGLEIYTAAEAVSEKIMEVENWRWQTKYRLGGIRSTLTHKVRMKADEATPPGQAIEWGRSTASHLMRLVTGSPHHI